MPVQAFTFTSKSKGCTITLEEGRDVRVKPGNLEQLAELARDAANSSAYNFGDRTT